MKLACSLFFVLTFALLEICAQTLTQEDAAFIDSIMVSNYKSTEPGAVILISKDSKPLFRKAYGLANLQLNVPNKPEYLFEIGSMTKQFTAVSMLQLAESGKLSLEDDLKKYLPDYNSHGRKITISNLLSHTSGITSYTEKNDFITKIVLDYSKQELVNYFMNDSLLFEPGTDWSYSNSAYVLVGLIIEKVSGMSLEEYMQKNIFIPAGMTHTFFGTYDKVIPFAVNGYEAADDTTYKPARYLSWTWPFGAGSIISNVDDLLKWDDALYSGKLITNDWINKAWSSFILVDGQKTNYGYGWALGEYKGEKIIAHGGGINGFVSDGIRIPSKHLYLVVLSNNESKSPDDFLKNIALRIAGLSYNSPEAIKLPASKLQEYTGVYELHRIGGRIVSNRSENKMYRYISIENDSLVSKRTGGSKEVLFNTAKDIFVFKGTQRVLRFNRDSKASIVSIEIYNEPVNYGPNEIEPRTSLPLPKEKVAIALDPKVIASYKGKYDFGGGFSITVIAKNDQLFIKTPGQAEEQIFGESESNFFLKSVDATIEFIKDNNVVTGMILNQGGKYKAKKIE